ncbi:Crp/Fnr family transcriptional regulator [Paracidovorax anthurii]|uniref:CRP-like cAMP-binding protein n=1 Tax=Paracidovorax anthurii TaxID=78229 RepID=A0A328YWN7_9BURK|nr:Crp/Fnr family transcriptional regulator [Paracidovorax anthurii]RAR77553.1 CRP-like cAMP-binding protein [Paracidovorax anthurii]
MQEALRDYFLESGARHHADARHVLLHAGDVAQRLYLIEQGCARLYLIDAQGRETSTQFFFEGEVVCSLESFLTGRPSALFLATIEPCRLRVVDGAAIKALAAADATLQADLQALMQQRLIHYVNLYASAIADSPTERYRALQATHHQRLDRIPLHILAAYLGVSAVHLSRIRRKLRESPPAPGP